MHWESDSKMDFISYLFFVIVFILGTVSNVESLFPKMGLNQNGRLPSRKATKAGFQIDADLPSQTGASGLSESVMVI